MKFEYMKKNGTYDMAYLVVNSLLKEIQESDLEHLENGTGIKLNRFLYDADSAADIILLCGSILKTKVIIRYNEDGKHTDRTAHCFHMSVKEKMNVCKAIRRM